MCLTFMHTNAGGMQRFTFPTIRINGVKHMVWFETENCGIPSKYRFTFQM